MCWRHVLVVLLAVSTVAFSQSRPASTAPASAAAALPRGVHVMRDLEYVPGGHARNRLDLYLPDVAPDRPLPVVVWVHGGGWTGGDKANCPAVWLAGEGYAVASVNYRFSQHAVFPAQVQDCKAAIRYLRAHSDEYRLDPAHVGAWGASSGGHLVALLGTTSKVNEFDVGANLEQSSAVQAVVDWCGPTDFLTCGVKDTRTNLIGGNPLEHPDKARYASPMTYVSKDACPFLIMHGELDDTVPIAQGTTFCEALKGAGVEATFVGLAGTKHGNGLYKAPETLGRVRFFFDRYLKGAPGQPGTR